MGLVELFGLLRKHEGPRQSVSRPVEKIIALCEALLSTRGEVSGSQMALEILAAYESLDEPARRKFFDLLAGEFSPDPTQVGRAGDAYRKQPSADTLGQLLRVVEPSRQELFRRLNMAPDATRVLVEMRARLLEELAEHPHWKSIEADLAHLLTSWFNRGFLVLRRIDWRTSAIILEKLIQYEAVHQIHGWDDLRRRLEADRRCYAFFHPVLPDEPIIFVEAALTRGMSDQVQPLLDPGTPVLDPSSADCAVFYSITNCQKGLRGVPLGSLLIKHVVEDVSRELPGLKTFATLSPVPDFRKWLSESAPALKGSSLSSNVERVLDELQNAKWPEDKQARAELQRDLVPLCAYYLMKAKQGREPRDSVARFHLRNGARLERINWLGDTSPMGLKRSAGLMVNYVYRLPEVERNHELYSREYKVMASHEIEALAKRANSSGGTASTGSRRIAAS